MDGGRDVRLLNYIRMMYVGMCADMGGKEMTILFCVVIR